jgi:hypothetical protein
LPPVLSLFLGVFLGVLRASAVRFAFPAFPINNNLKTGFPSESVTSEFQALDNLKANVTNQVGQE